MMLPAFGFGERHLQEHVRKLSVSGAALSYRLMRGERPRRLLVLIHGMASNMTRWTEFVETTTLADSWDILRFDLRGHAQSLFRGKIGMEVWCSDIAGLLDAEGYGKAVLAGHCLGANLALQFAKRHAYRTAGVILIEPMLPQALTGSLRRLQPFKPLIRVLIALIRSLNRLGIHRRSIAALDLRELDRRTRDSMAAEGSPDALRGRYAVPWHDLRYLPSANYLQEFIEVSRPCPPLHDIAVPVLALVSTGRFLSDPDVTRTQLADLPNCRTVTLDSEHWIPTERPQEMRIAIERWCREL